MRQFPLPNDSIRFPRTKPIQATKPMANFEGPKVERISRAARPHRPGQRVAVKWSGFKDLSKTSPNEPNLRVSGPRPAESPNEANALKSSECKAKNARPSVRQCSSAEQTHCSVLFGSARLDSARLAGSTFTGRSDASPNLALWEPVPKTCRNPLAHPDSSY